MELLTLIHSVGRDGPEGLEAILGVAVGALVVGVLWWRGATGRIRTD